MNNTDASPVPSASAIITSHIAQMGDWRGQTLARIRKLILDADTRVVEEWKWATTPAWSRNGLVCICEEYPNALMLVFVKGALLSDPRRLFNSSLDGRARRAIELFEGEGVDEAAFKALVRQAIALNASRKTRSSQKAKSKDWEAP